MSNTTDLPSNWDSSASTLNSIACSRFLLYGFKYHSITGNPEIINTEYLALVLGFLLFFSTSCRIIVEIETELWYHRLEICRSGLVEHVWKIPNKKGKFSLKANPFNFHRTTPSGIFSLKLKRLIGWLYCSNETLITKEVFQNESENNFNNIGLFSNVGLQRHRKGTRA
jgi:hypothetical protein